MSVNFSFFGEKRAVSELIMKHLADERSSTHHQPLPEEDCTHPDVSHPTSHCHGHYPQRDTQTVLLHPRKAWLIFSSRHILNTHKNGTGREVDFPGSLCGNESPSPWPSRKREANRRRSLENAEQLGGWAGQKPAGSERRVQSLWKNIFCGIERASVMLVPTPLAAWHDSSLVIWMPNLKLVVIIGN